MITFRLQLTDFQKLYSFLGNTKNLKGQISNTCLQCHKIVFKHQNETFAFFINEKHVQK